MKRIAQYLFIVVLLFSSVNPAMAGFWVKSATHASATSATSGTSTAAILQHSKVAETMRPAKLLSLSKMYGRSYRQSEWVAIGAFIFGMLGLLIPFVNFLAILLGLLSMGRGGKVQGLAIAGFILGVLELILFIFAGGITFASLIML